MNRSAYSPKWINKKYKERDKNPQEGSGCNKITDFLVLIECIWRISNQEYQKRIWVNHETPEIVDSYDDTMMYFLEDAYAVLEAPGSETVKMTDQQRKMLKKLYHIVDTYDMDKAHPEHDQEIVEDPNWDTIRKYAKLVYEEITKK